MGYNKFITKDNTTLLDLTGDDLTNDTSKVLNGYKYHGRDGVQYTGTGTGGGGGDSYTITTNVTGGTYTGSTATFGSPNTAQVTISANSGFELPLSVSVSGASYSYNSSTGVIALTNATGDITITAVCVGTYTITGTITNGTMSGDSTIISDRTASVTITPSTNYYTPADVTVVGASYTYNMGTGVITLSNPTDNVVITATCVGTYTITGNITNGSLTGATEIIIGRTAVVNIVGNDGYAAPQQSGVTVTNATIDNYNSGTLTIGNPTGNVTITATCVEGINKGTILNIDMTGSGTAQQYRVIKTLTSDIVEVFAMADENSSIAFDSDGKNTYEGKELDTYLNSTWYDTLSSTAKNALVAKTFTQDSWYNGTTGNPDYQGNSRYNSYQLSLANAAYGNEITRNVYALSVQDIIDYLGVTPEMTTDNTTLTYTNLWQMFWNDTSSHNVFLWLRSANSNFSDRSRAVMIFGNSGQLIENPTNDSIKARAAFQVDLSKISWTR